MYTLEIHHDVKRYACCKHFSLAFLSTSFSETKTFSQGLRACVQSVVSLNKAPYKLVSPCTALELVDLFLSRWFQTLADPTSLVTMPLCVPLHDPPLLNSAIDLRGRDIPAVVRDRGREEGGKEPTFLASRSSRARFRTTYSLLLQPLL